MRRKLTNHKVDTRVMLAIGSINSGFGKLGTIISRVKSTFYNKGFDYTIQFDDGIIDTYYDDAIWPLDYPPARIGQAVINLV